MLKAATYSARETLRDGRRLEIRALKPDDRADLEAAVGRVSDQSLYRRFFEIKHHFSEQEIAFFLNVDFVNHVAFGRGGGGRRPPRDRGRHPLRRRAAWTGGGGFRHR
jgi:hypothetical protein